MRIRLGLIVLVALLVACGGPKISKPKAQAIVENAREFKAAKLVYVPRQIAIPADGIGNNAASREGEALTIIQIAAVDPVVAILRARDRVTIEDFVSADPNSIVLPTKPVIDTTPAKKDTTPKSPLDSLRDAREKAAKDSAKAVADSIKPKKLTSNAPPTSPPPAPPLAQSWVHTLRVTPHPELQTSELQPDDGDDNPESPRASYNPQPIGRSPGWTLAIANREFMRIGAVLAYTPSRSDPAGDAIIDFAWRWRPTKPGALFDTESAQFESLPRELQQAALTGAVTVEASTQHWARATLSRDGANWKVTSVNWTYGDDKQHDR